MNKIVNYIIILSLLLAVSCNLEKKPFGAMDSESSISNVNDVRSLVNNVYINIRSLYSGGSISNMEISADAFHATRGYGNRGGVMYRWSWDASSDAIESTWARSYAIISTSYFIIEGIEKMNRAGFTEENNKQIEEYKGTCHFAIALAYFTLAERYCSGYDANTADNPGVCLIDKYYPTSISGHYPARASLKATYDRINMHMIHAESLLKDVEGVKDSEFITSDAVTALKARIALIAGDWETAITCAESLITGGKYPLISNENSFKNMWISDNGNESIVQLDATKTPASLPNANGTYYVGYDAVNKIYSPDYIPAKWIIDLYDQMKDIRFKAYFQEQELIYPSENIKAKAYICTKFPGNPNLYSGNSNYVNKVKLFRIAEQYLILAEAYAMRGGSDAIASTYLNQLKVKRIKGYDDSRVYTGEVLQEEIKNERVRELFAEGYRFLDIKRKKADLKRTEAQNKNLVFQPNSESTELLEKAAGDFRFLFPIPQAELDSNPQIKNQQNPGY